MGPGEVFPQRRRQEVRGLDGKGGLRLGGDGLVAVDRDGGLQRRWTPRLRGGKRGPEHAIPRRSGTSRVALLRRFLRPRLQRIVEAYYENGQLYPWRSRTDLGAAIPSVLRRYRWNNDYARATLPEILGADRLASATRLEATELRSGVFLSQPDGRYRFEPLPRIAQIAPADGIVAGDFEGEGHADIYIVQNSYAPAPAIGRFDGGLSQLLRGDGHGHFSPVPPIESGLVVPGDAKALAVARPRQRRLAGLPGLAQRGSDARLPQSGLAGLHSLRVELQGPPGNRQAWGRASRPSMPTAQPKPAKSAPARATTASRPRPNSSAPRIEIRCGGCASLAVRRDDDEPKFWTRDSGYRQAGRAGELSDSARAPRGPCAMQPPRSRYSPL
jgi:hypothetical protein